MLEKFLSFARQQALGLIALFVALGGTSYAVATGSIDSREIKDNTVRSRDIRNNDVRGGDIRNGSLLARDFKPGQLPAGAQGSQGPQGDPGAQGPQGLQGDPGADGATGSALLSGVGDAVPSVAPGVTVFRRATPTGYSMVTLFATERATLSPGRALVVRDLAARTVNDLPTGGTVQVQLFVDQPPVTNEGPEDATLECTVTGTGGSDDRTCGAAGPVAVPAASTLFVRLVVAGGTSANTDPDQVRWGITVEPAS